MEESRDYLIKTIIVIMLVITLLLVLVALGFSAAFDANTPSPATLEAVTVSGEFCIPGEKWLSFEGTPELDEETNRILVRGHVDNTIEKGTDVMFFAERTYVTLKVNGITVVDIHETRNAPNNVMATGSTWTSFKSQGISPEDELEFSVCSSREKLLQGNLDSLFESICQGEAEVLYQRMLEENGIQMFFGLVAIFGGIILLIVGLCSLGSNYNFMKRIVSISVMVICGGIWFLLDTNCVYLSMLIPNNAVHNFLDFSISFLMPISVVLYLLTLLNEGGIKRVLYDVIFVMLVLTILPLVLQLLGIRQLYEMQNLAIAVGFLMLVAIVAFVIHSVKTNNRINKIVVIALTPGIIGGFLQVASYLSEGSFAVEHLLSIGILISVLSQLAVLIVEIRISAKMIRDMQANENQQMKNRILITLSQLQPHFLFNALNAIQYLCTINPEQAKKGVENFARCLRGNIDSLRINHPITFAQELKHLQSYVYMERVRFGEDINVEYNIETEDFMIPPLTVQPIVENAIRHGITQRDGGGHIVVSAKEEAAGVCITVTDDGIGFDAEAMERSVRYNGYEINAVKPHVGIPTVRDRLKSMCNGTLKVESVIEGGTTVTIFIPDEQEQK